MGIPEGDAGRKAHDLFAVERLRTSIYSRIDPSYKNSP
jgi:hypothetical protein